jgi:hypothetical protein
VHCLNAVYWIEKVSLTRTWRGAANIYTCYCSILGQDYCATGWSPRISEVSDFDAGNLGNRTLIFTQKAAAKRCDVSHAKRCGIAHNACAGRRKSAADNLAPRRF